MNSPDPTHATNFIETSKHEFHLKWNERFSIGEKAILDRVQIRCNKKEATKIESNCTSRIEAFGELLRSVQYTDLVLELGTWKMMK